VVEHAPSPSRTPYAEARERFGLETRFAGGGRAAHGHHHPGPGEASENGGGSGHDHSGRGSGSGRATDPDHGKQEEGHQ